MSVDYQKIVNHLMKKIGFSAIKEFRKVSSSGLFVILGEAEGEKVVLRTSPISLEDKIAKLKKEFVISQALKDINHSSGFVKVLRMGEFSNLFWSLREYSSGEILSEENLDNEILHGFDNIKEKYLGMGGKIISNTVSEIKLIQGLSRKTFSEDTDFKARFSLELAPDSLIKLSALLEISFEGIIQKHKKIEQQVSNSRPQVFAMGDLIPSNIIIDNNQVKLFDFEWFSVDNQIFDYSFFWLFLWRYKEWQDLLISLVIKTDDDKIIFQLNIIRILTAWFQEAMSVKSRAEQIKRIDFYKNHTWFKYLQSAGQSFEEIMNVK